MNNKGLTLVEVIITITIISIVSMILLPVFGSGLKNIFFSGERTKILFEVQKKIDEAINDPSDIEEGEELLIVNKDITVTIDEVVDKKEISGKLITVQSKVLKRRNQIKLTTFILD